MKRLAALLVSLTSCTAATAQWVAQDTGTKARLRGLCVVGKEITWASGTGGTFLRTVDGGGSWRVGAVAGASALDFRDVHAVDARTAYVLSIGPGEQSRIRATTSRMNRVRFSNDPPYLPGRDRAASSSFKR